jgi:hypothetical protein
MKTLDVKDYPTDGVITLRPAQIDDAPAVYEAVCESLETLRPWMSWAHDGYRQEEAYDFILRSIEGWEEDDFYTFFITDAKDGTLLGGSGLRRLARLNFDKSEYLKTRLRAAGVQIPFTASTFNEFVAVFPADFQATWSRLLQEKIVAGLPLWRWYPELAGHYLFCVTETASRADLDHLAAEVSR